MKSKAIILHMDADSFFASCEISRNPKYKGKPVVVGGSDRGIAVAISLEAKKRGIYRGMNNRDMKAICKDVIALPVDMRLYGLYSDSMFSIFEKYVDKIERYSIDECFGLLYSDSMEEAKEIAERIRKEVEKKLAITVSLGVSNTKVLAKIASKQNKPNGVFVIDKNRKNYINILSNIEIGKIWGIGSKGAIFLNQKGIKSALDFVSLPRDYVLRNFDKALREIFFELNGESIHSIDETFHVQKSMQKTRTFKPVSSDINVLKRELSRNIERAFVKARAINMAPKEIHIMIKTSEFKYLRKSISFNIPITNESIIIKRSIEALEEIFQKGLIYRSTGITLSSLYPVGKQDDLFGESVENKKLLNMYKFIDSLGVKYGKKLIRFGSSCLGGNILGQRIAKIDLDSKRLRIPFLGEVA